MSLLLTEKWINMGDRERGRANNGEPGGYRHDASFSGNSVFLSPSTHFSLSDGTYFFISECIKNHLVDITWTGNNDPLVRIKFLLQIKPPSQGEQKGRVQLSSTKRQTSGRAGIPGRAKSHFSRTSKWTPINSDRHPTKLTPGLDSWGSAKTRVPTPRPPRSHSPAIVCVCMCVRGDLFRHHLTSEVLGVFDIGGAGFYCSKNFSSKKRKWKLCE